MSSVKTFINKIASPYPGFAEAAKIVRVKAKSPAPTGLYGGVNKRSQDAERLIMQGHNSLKDAKRYKDMYNVQAGTRKNIAKQSLVNSMVSASDSYRKAYKTNPVVARRMLGRKPSLVYQPLDRGAILTAMEKVQAARESLMEKNAK